MIRARHAATIRKAIRHARANHQQANLTAMLARAYEWPAEAAYFAAAQALNPPVEHLKSPLFMRAYEATLNKQPHITVHHPGCKCGHKQES